MTGEEWEEVEQAVEPPYGRAERIILVMLNLLLTDYHSEEKPKTTVVEDVKPESFEWVIKEAIRLIKEKGEYKNA